MDSLVSRSGCGEASRIAGTAAPPDARRRRDRRWIAARPGLRGVLAAGLLAGFLVSGLGLGISANAARQDHQHVINLAGKQRMLSQKLSKEAVLVALEVDKDANLRNLRSTHALFALTLRGLRHGDASLGLPQTERQEILDLLTRVEQLWADLDRSLQPVLSAGKASEAQIAALAELNLPLLKAMNEAVLAYEKAAYEGIAFSANAAAINLSGRQRMLSQKMTKEFLLVAYGHEPERNRRALGATVELFESTLTGLIVGDPANRLFRAPTREIEAQLAVVRGIWARFSTLLTPVAGGKTPEAEVIAQVSEINIELLYETNKVVEMYEAL